MNCYFLKITAKAITKEKSKSFTRKDKALTPQKVKSLHPKSQNNYTIKGKSLQRKKAEPNDSALSRYFQFFIIMPELSVL
jgi:hypothetical protein